MGGGGRGLQGLYLIAPDGILHILGENSGLDIRQPVPFLAPGENATALSVIDGIAYVFTSRACGGSSNGLQAVELAGEPQAVASWPSNGRPIGAPAFGTDGTVYVSLDAAAEGGPGTTNAVVALEPRTLRVKDWFSPATAAVATAPIVIRDNGRDLVAAATDDGRIMVLDARELGGPSRKEPYAISADHVTGRPVGLASHVDGSGGRHILMAVDKSPSTGAVIDFTLDGDRALKQSWVVSELTKPAVPVVVNGVVFALSTGDRQPGPASSSVLYAVDSLTGKTLWTSGRDIAGSAEGSLVVGNSQVYVLTRDRVLYAFGFAMDR
jgi:outer membrane protein assembly factor BamB